MKATLSNAVWTAVAIGLAIIGCTTALAITGHVSGDVAINTFLLVGGGAIGITGAHVGGVVASGSAGSTAVPAPGTAPTVAPSPSGVPPASPAPVQAA